MAIKKAFVPLMELLEANKQKTVSSILSQVEEICSAKSAGGTATTVHKDKDGNITHIRCGYFKKWMPLSHVEFGAKAGSASGYNPMCKEGVANWTKAQRDFRKDKEDLFEKVMSKEISPEQAQKMQEKLEKARTTIVPHSAGIGWDTVEEAVKVSKKDLDAMVAKVTPQEAA